MAFSKTFSIYPAKPAFGTFRESVDAGDYIKNKAAKATYCQANLCPSFLNTKSQSDLLLLRQAKNLSNNRCFQHGNNNDLNSNLYTKLDLNDICVIKNVEDDKCPTTIDPSLTFLGNYEIDPNGNLFGNTQCSINNYLNYRIYNPPH
jgi:hypothetical protein